MSAAVASAGTLSEHLAVWLTSDSGVETNASGVVTKWANRGTLGSVYDVAPMTPAKAAVTVRTDDVQFGARPVVALDGTDPLVSEGGSADLFSASGGACFIVYRTGTAYSGALWCASPSYDGNHRVGSWFGDGTMVCAFYGSYANSITAIPAANGGYAHCFCDTTFVADGTRSERSFVRSVQQGKVAGVRPGIVPAEARLWIGDFEEWGKKTGKYLLGSVAEVRIYNRALTATERAAVDFELSSKYGLQTEAFGLAKATPPAGYTHGVVGAGHALDGGAPAGTVLSATSGGAVFSFVTEPEVSSDALVVLANDGGEGMSRKWWLGGDQAARACLVKLSFPFSSLADGKIPVLRARLNGQSAWTTLDCDPEVDSDRIIFSLPAGWSNGEYQLSDMLSAGLAVWLTSDSGVETNASGVVTKWANRGTLGSVYDVAPMTPAKAAVTVRTDDVQFGVRPVVALDGTDPLVSEDGSAELFSTSGGACFIVYRTGTAYSGALWCASPSYDGSHRVGSWFSDGTMVCAFYGSYANSVTAIPAANGGYAHCFCDTTFVADGVRSERAFVRSVPQGKVAGTRPGIVPAKSKLWIGDFEEWGKTTGKYLMGSVAEVRIYNRALTATERAAVDFELSSKYGLQTEAFGLAKAAPPAGYTHGVVGAGHALDGGAPAGTVLSATSGGAVFSFVTVPEASSDALVVLANDGGEGASRKWWLGGDQAARACNVSLSFDAVPYESAGDVCLQCRSSTTGAWKIVPTTRADATGRMIFVLAPGWASGEYAIVRPAKLLPAVWFRADLGLETDRDGRVVSWANQGSIGESFDLSVCAAGESSASLSVVSDFGGRKAVSFDGSGWLETAIAAYAGDTVDGGTWYVVYNPGRVEDTNNGLFAFDRDNGSARWGAFIGNRELRGYWRGNSESDIKLARTQGQNQIVSMTASADQLAAANFVFCGGKDGVENVVRKNVARSAGVSGVFCLGKMISWTNPFIGRIAEFRFYNHPLSATERKTVELEIAARYGLPVDDASAVAVSQYATCDTGSATIGNWEDHNADVETRTTATLDGLKLAYVQEPATDVNSVGLVAADNKAMSFSPWTVSSRYPEAVARSWFFHSALGAPGVKLEFDLVPAVDRYRYALFHADGTGSCRRVRDAVVSTSGTGITVTLDHADTGVYRLARGPLAEGLVISVR